MSKKKKIIYSIIFILILGYFVAYIIDVKITERQLEQQALRNQEKNAQVKACKDAGGTWMVGHAVGMQPPSKGDCFLPKK